MRIYSGNEIGPFRAIEESIVAQLTTPENRSDIYAWYSLFGLAGAAFGMITCGWLLQLFTDIFNWDLLYSYRAIFVIYAVIGLLKLSFTLFLSHSVESEKKQARKARTPRQGDETTPLLTGEGPGGGPGAPVQVNHKSGLRRLFPEIGKDSVSVVTTLCFLFGLDAFGTGVNPL